VAGLVLNEVAEGVDPLSFVLLLRVGVHALRCPKKLALSFSFLRLSRTSAFCACHGLKPFPTGIFVASLT
jgi:hypothetical protein